MSSVRGVAEQQIGEVTGLNVKGERVATLEGVRIQGIHSSGYKLTDYQQYTSLHAETVRLDGWNKYVIGFGVGTVLLGIGGVCFSPPLVLV